MPSPILARQGRGWGDGQGRGGLPLGPRQYLQRRVEEQAAEAERQRKEVATAADQLEQVGPAPSSTVKWQWWGGGGDVSPRASHRRAENSDASGSKVSLSLGGGHPCPP